MIYIIDGLKLLQITLTDMFGEQIAEGIVITIISVIGPLFLVAISFAAWQIIKAIYWVFKGVAFNEIIHRIWENTKETASDMLEMLAFPIFLYIQFAGPIVLVCMISVSFGWWGPILATILVAAMIAFVLWPSPHSPEGILLSVWIASFVIFTTTINILGAYLRILLIPVYVLKYASQTIRYLMGKSRH